MSNMRIPGPTPYYDGVYDGLNRQMISHRSLDYEKLHTSIIEKLKPFFGTQEHIYILTSSGTGGMEAGICNLFNPGDTVISFTVGTFGDRWIKIAKAFGLNVVEVSFPMGSHVDLEKAQKIFQENENAKGVLITYNETSTAILNPIKEFAVLCKKLLPNALLLVDAVSVLGAVPMKMDEWGVDFVTTGAQKAWGAPAGLCMVGMSDTAYKKMYETQNYRFYFDLRLADKYSQKNQTPTTPAVGSLYGLEGALTTMHKEGIDNIFSRHIQLRDAFREGIRKIGLSLLVEDTYASPTVTAVRAPEGVDSKDWQRLLSDKYDTLVAGGKGELVGKIIRVAHMGCISQKDIDITLDTITKSVADLHKHL